jgi:hypothetical protein
VIRHAGLLTAFAILPLAVTMIEPSFRALLMPPVSAALSIAPGRSAAGQAAIAVSAVAMSADEKHRPAATSYANSLSQNCIAMCRHAFSQAVLDNGSGFVGT